MQVAIIGLGLMGSAFAKRIAEGGHDVTGFDIDPAREEASPDQPFRRAGSIEAAVGGAEVVILSLPNSQIGLDVAVAPGGLAELLPAGAIVVDTTTARPADTLVIGAALEQRGIGFVDATVSGNPPQALKGDLVVMAGGKDEHVTAVAPVLACFGRSIHRVGPTGSGARTKLLVNHLLGIHRVAIAEVLVVAQKAGLALPELLEVLADSAAYSKAIDYWGERMAAGSHYPPTGRLVLTKKDLDLISEQAQEVGASSDLVDAALRVVEEAMDAGLGDADNSVVMEALRRRAGVPAIEQ